jgi:hypothetical protein
MGLHGAAPAQWSASAAAPLSPFLDTEARVNRCGDTGAQPMLRLVALPIALLLAQPAWAQDLFEIQVYEGDLDEPGQAGLELHLNDTFRGLKTAEAQGEVPPDGVARATLEPSLGIARWLELGAYFRRLLAELRGAGRQGALGRL